MYLCTVQNDLLLKNFVPSLKFYFHHSPKRLEGQISLYLHFVGDETGTLPCDLHFSYWRKRNWNFGHSILLIPQLAQAFFFSFFFLPQVGDRIFVLAAACVLCQGPPCWERSMEVGHRAPGFEKNLYKLRMLGFRSVFLVQVDLWVIISL